MRSIRFFQSSSFKAQSLSKSFFLGIFLTFLILLLIQGVQAQNQLFIDPSVKGLPIAQAEVSGEAFHLFTHGRPGELLIEGEWRSTEWIGGWLLSKEMLLGRNHLNIYGCEFGKGEEGDSLGSVPGRGPGYICGGFR